MTVTLERSRGLLVYLVVIHAMAASLVFFLQAEGFITLLLCVLLMLSLLVTCCHYGWFGKQANIQKLHCDAQGRWLISGSNADSPEWRLQHSVILGPLIILKFKASSKRRIQSVLVTRDAVDREGWRQLCLKLRDPETWD